MMVVMAKTEKATFALGCFWHPDDYFSKLDGVVSTRVGYAGGTTPNPTYETLGDHTETTEVVYDSEKISYETLLKEFFNQHDPSLDVKTQYKSIIFTHDDEQKKTAGEALQEQQKKSTRPIRTEIRAVGEFREAEDYHQKYYAKQRDAAF